MSAIDIRDSSIRFVGSAFVCKFGISVPLISSFQPSQVPNKHFVSVSGSPLPIQQTIMTH